MGLLQRAMDEWESMQEAKKQRHETVKGWLGLGEKATAGAIVPAAQPGPSQVSVHQAMMQQMRHEDRHEEHHLVVHTTTTTTTTNGQVTVTRK
jgi:hypothetical protein